MKNPDLIIFAKQPIPGKCKTRLLDGCDEKRAAEISRFLIRATTQLAVENWPGDVFLYGAPDSQHPLFAELKKEFHIALGDQVEGDLGEKMMSALSYHIKDSEAAAVIGTDVPHCSDDIIERAYDLLSRGKDVVGPADDGGYYLIGLNKAEASIFSDIKWGGPTVLQTTIRRAQAAGLNLVPLPILKDIDTWQDLWLISKIYKPLSQFVDEAT